MAALLAAAAACSERTSTGDPVPAGQKLGSKKPIRITNKGERIGRVDPDVALLTGADPPKGAKVDQGALVRMADTAAERGRYAIAASLYDRAVRGAPKDVALHRKLGFALFRAREFDRAKAVFDATLALAPNDPGALRGLGNVQVARGDPGAAIATYRRALKASTGRFADYRIYNGLGVALDLSGRHRTAQRAYRLGLAQAPDNGSLRNNYALSLAASGQYAQAIRMLRKLVREQKASVKYRQNLERVRAKAAKAGVKVSRRPPQPAARPAPRRSKPAKAARRDKTPARRVARAIGPPRRIVPRTLPNIKALNARTDRREVAPANTPEPARAKIPDTVVDPAERDLLFRLHPGAKSPAKAPGKATTATARAKSAPRKPSPALRADTTAAALNRMAPGAGPTDLAAKPAPDPITDLTTDRAGEPDEAEKADRLFLKALRGGAPRRE